MKNIDLYNGIARDLSDGRIQRIDESPTVKEFFELPTNETASRILVEEWDGQVIFENLGKGFGDRKFGKFYRKTPGTWYENFNNVINAATEVIVKKLMAYAWPLIQEGKPENFNHMQAALRKARSRDFIESSLVYFCGHAEVPDLSKKWNATTEALPILDGIADFSGTTLIIREARLNEYFRDPLPITSSDLMEGGEPKAFLRFIGDLFPDADTRRSALELLSLSITNIGQRMFAIWKGQTSNGKSLLGEVMRQVLGEFGGVLSGSALIKGDTGAKRFAASDLAGKRFVMAEEISRPLDVEEVKRLTGGEPVKVERKGLPEVLVPANWLLCVSTNNMPRFEESDKDPSGFLDRLFVLPFKVQFYANEDHKQQLIRQGGREEFMRPQREPREIIHKIMQERGQVIRFLIETWFRVRENKGRPYQSRECKDAYESYRIANDSIAEFISQNFKYAPAARVEYSVIIAKWLEHFGEKNAPTTQKIIKYILDHFDRYQRDVRAVRSHGVRYLENIAVYEPENDPDNKTEHENTTLSNKDSFVSSSWVPKGDENDKNQIDIPENEKMVVRLENDQNRHPATPADTSASLSDSDLLLASKTVNELLQAAEQTEGKVPIEWSRDACAEKGLTPQKIAAAEVYMQQVGLLDGEYIKMADEEGNNKAPAKPRLGLPEADGLAALRSNTQEASGLDIF